MIKSVSTLTLVFVLCLLVSMLHAASTVKKAGSLANDPAGNVVQAPTFNGSKARVITSASTTIDFSGDAGYHILCTTDGWERWMPASNSTKASYVQTPIPSGSWQGSAINSATKFGNFSGATCYIKRQ